MYVGSGDDSTAGDSRAFIINLINGTVLYEFGVEDGFALRDLSYFDSSALVDAETDTLIYPGESGILYTIKLNTQYDPNAGTISINPQTVKWRYKGAGACLRIRWMVPRAGGWALRIALLSGGSTRSLRIMAAI